ncbi:MAG: substrate-binding periplasmic protein [Gammaproteobacteria bacterium]
MTFSKIFSKLSSLTCLGLFSGFAVASNQLCQRPITIGWENWPPYQYEKNIRNTKKITGLDLEIVQSILDDMGCQSVYVSMPWKRHLTQVQQGLLDLATGASLTPEREQFVYFSDAYRNETMSLFVLKESLEKIKFQKIIQLEHSNFLLGLVFGYEYGNDFNQLKQSSFKKNIFEVNHSEKNFKKLLKNEIQGLLEDKIVGHFYLKLNKLQDRISEHPLFVNSDPVYIMLSKKSLNEDFLRAFNQSLKKLKDSGKLNQIINGYIN